MNALKNARIEKGISQKEAAKSIGISYSLLVKLENGLRGASDKNKIKIARFYQKSIQDIFFDKSITKSDYKELAK
ncbi:helix-turn-helix transcriptional regulator [Enterococcus durans]|uniref:helix-turn-helix transcriptional regulator n=1 Tax=Enterococcus durans TaxID=53345 RepID=UPI00232EA271|nr:helix-turn-helix transcriptional regulator [Enterococcus durans]WCG26454.1 helix-turn-helix transcriptional regulator [Enterococcus durans]WCG68018.1 helix-turn-helix transcriptional regulator [Enterococcus durans]